MKFLKFLLVLFLPFISFAQSNDLFSCMEKSIIKIDEGGNFNYIDNYLKSYNFKKTQKYIIFFESSPGTGDYIKLPILINNDDYFKIDIENINISIQFARIPSKKNNDNQYFLRFVKNDIYHSEISFSICERL